LALLLAHPALADPLRVAIYSANLDRFGPGILLSDLKRPTQKQIDPVIEVILRLDADILLITDIDYDARDLALTALQDRLEARGLIYRYRFALRPNSGVPTGLDMDGDGALGTADDAMGYGSFAGSAGMALLSRYPIDAASARDFTGLLWRDLPGQIMPPTAPEVAQIQRLSSTGHWDVPIELPDGQILHILAYSATPPVFDGPEDRNGRRNHDETALWLAYLAGKLPPQAPLPPPDGPFILMGTANLDPADGDGRRGAIAALLAHPALQDPAPQNTSDHIDPTHKGDPTLDTALFPAPTGGLRVDLLLPSHQITVIAAGVLWPAATDPFTQTLQAASRHAPIWADIALPPQN
jgi:hypothetical protein